MAAARRRPTSSSSTTTRPTSSATWPTPSPRRSRRSPRDRRERRARPPTDGADVGGRAETPTDEDARATTRADGRPGRRDAAEGDAAGDDAARPDRAGRQPGDPARANGSSRSTLPSSRPAPGPASSSTSGPVTCPGSSCAGRSRSTPPTPATGTITIHFRTIGRGTEWFTHLRPGDAVDMLGPLGRPFEVDPRSRHLLLIAGGLGMAGVRSLADEAIRDGRQVTLLFGGGEGARRLPVVAAARRGRVRRSRPTTARSATTGS